MSSLATMIRDARKEAQITQAALAEKFGYSSPQFVSNWERGLARPPKNLLPRLCKVLRLDTKKVVATLLKETENELKSVFKH